MANDYTVTQENLSAIADAIRVKTGQAGLIPPDQMAAEIAAIPSGGGGKLASVVDGTVTEITAEDLAGATFIKDYSFRNCSALESVVIPDGVTTINTEAFYKCTSLKSVIIPNSVTSIGDYSFMYCSSLENIVIPGSVTYIGVDAFAFCSSLKSVTFEDGNGLEMRSEAFSNCTSLETINWPQTSVSIKDVFRKCTALTTLVIPSNVEFSSSMYAFQNCTSLINLEIGSPEIPRNTFTGCTALSKIWLRSSVNTIQLYTQGSSVGKTGPFYNSSASATLYCEPASKPSGWETGFNLYSGTVDNVTLTTVYNQTSRPF